ncbi:MAG: TRAP transporter large permease subunit [Rhodospirillaceae bacterium]|nr:TRAP transporter large permease subunit [Rhodospirillaceae bacterium]MBT4937528.1 TRAP transporter large permease subunit [Rhodospirillaceae bacterium]MBT7267881.1 TRAP transporter large permease subunit [Rhodospirillaceae bacterium]
MRQLALGLAFILVLMGMANNLPNIPGLLETIRMIPGLENLPRITKYSPEFFFPLTFAFMMVIALLTSSFAKDWRNEKPAKYYLGILLDVLLLTTIIGMAVIYLVENEQVCLIDTLNGDRGRAMAENRARAEEYMAIFGTPPDEDFPDCITNLGNWILPFLVMAIGVFFVYIVKVWGLPIVAVAIAISIYTVVSAAAWYFDWTDNKYLTTSIGTVAEGVRGYTAAVVGARNAIILESNGILGQFLNITVNVVFPYVVLGSLFGASAGGRSLIKMAVVLTRKLRGGPAHAAIVGSATFGTISGGPVVNVLGTGTLTIPMMIKNGFKPVFAGGVEAAASSGGQIMPPVMGIAAFVLAALSSVPYSDVIVAAFIPAVAYFFSLFLMVVFESRRMKIEAVRELSEEQKLTREDYKNLIMIAGPILVILILLLSTKDTVGEGFSAFLFGYDKASGEAMPWVLKVYQNAAGSPGSAGFWAVIILVVLLFLDPEIRKAPRKVILALSDAGIIIAELFLLLVAVSVIDVCISFTNFTGILTIDVLNWLKSVSTFSFFGHEFVLGGALYLMLALFVAMLATILLGMGMPTLPAYVNVILIIGPLLAALGTSFFTAHMFVFYFAVASAITPPVAIAAFAASTISKSEPLATGFAAVRAGIVMFTIPFVFAFYPEILLIEQAQVMQSLEGGTTAKKEYLPGYDGTINMAALSWLLFKLVVILYLVASALSRQDKYRLSPFDIALRCVLALLILLKIPLIANSALVVAGLYLAFHHFGGGKLLAPKQAP